MTNRIENPESLTLEPRAGGRRLLIILNPQAGRRQQGRLEAVLERLTALGCAITLRRTRARGDAEALARAALGEGFDALVAAGGDGTINEVINGLAGSRQPLAILPLGTANVLALEIGLPQDPRAVAEVIARAPARPIRLAEAGGRFFVMMAGVGLDARIIDGVSLRLKRLSGKLAYAVQTVVQLLRYRRREYEVTVAGVRYGAGSVIVANGHFYGGRFICAPQASLESPLLHVCLFTRPGRWNALRYAAALLTGRLGRLKDYRIVAATALTIAGPAGDPVQADGDISARLPVEIRLAEAPLYLIQPSAE